MLYRQGPETPTGISRERKYIVIVRNTNFPRMFLYQWKISVGRNQYVFKSNIFVLLTNAKEQNLIPLTLMGLTLKINMT